MCVYACDVAVFPATATQTELRRTRRVTRRQVGHPPVVFCTPGNRSLARGAVRHSTDDSRLPFCKIICNARICIINVHLKVLSIYHKMLFFYCC